MMSHNNLNTVGRDVGEAKAQLAQLTAADPAIFPGKCACRVDPCHRNLVIDIPWLEVLRDMAAETIEHAEEPGEDVVQWNVMVPGNNQLGEGNAIEKLACSNELFGPRPLRKVAGNDDQVRPGRSNAFEKRRDKRRLYSSEVKIGEMNECPHQAVCFGGTITRRAAARDR